MIDKNKHSAIQGFRKKSGLNYILLFATIIASALLLASSIAMFIDPRHFWPMAFAGLFYPIWLLINLFIVIYWLIKRSWLALFPLVCLLIASYHIPNCIGLKKIFTADNNAKVIANHLRVMTWNVRYFQAMKGNDKRMRTAALNLIRKVQPDIICIQEFYDRTNMHENLNDSISKILSSDQYFFKPFKLSYSGMAIFSKYPIRNTGFVQLSPISINNQCIFADIVKNGKVVRIYNVHLRSSRLPRNFDKTAQLYGTGITGKVKKYWAVIKKLKQGFIYRGLQVNKLTKAISISENPYIIAGDFNDTQTSYTYKQLSAGLKNTFTEKGHGIGKTHWGGYPDVQIDYILVNPAYKVLNYTMIERKLSDHYPIYVDLELQ